MIGEIKKTHKNEDIQTFDEVKIDPNQPIYTTQVICKLLEIPVWTLRKLDKEGLVNPFRESDNKARLYSHNELKKIKHCWLYMKEHHVRIPALKMILELEKEGKNFLP